MTQGSVGEELIPGAMGGRAGDAHPVARCADEKDKRAIERNRRSELTKKRSAVDDEMVWPPVTVPLGSRQQGE